MWGFRGVPSSRAELGETLVELLVVMLAVAIISPLLIGILLDVGTTSRATITTAQSVSDARLALAYLDKQVRSANQPLTVTATTLSMNTCADQSGVAAGTVRLVDFRLSNGRLEARTYPAAGPVASWTTLLTGLSATSGFTATGSGAVSVTLRPGPGPGPGPGRGAEVSSVLAPRNPQLSTPLPTQC